MGENLGVLLGTCMHLECPQWWYHFLGMPSSELAWGGDWMGKGTGCGVRVWVCIQFPTWLRLPTAHVPCAFLGNKTASPYALVVRVT